jgi:hypothetical protein
MNSITTEKTITARLLRYLALPAALFSLAAPVAEARQGHPSSYYGGHSSYHRGGPPAHANHPGNRGYYAPTRHAAPRYHAPVHYYAPVRYAPVYHHVYRPHVHYPRYVTVLPHGCRQVYRGGVMYHYVNGSYYRPHFQNHSRVFVQVHF